MNRRLLLKAWAGPTAGPLATDLLGVILIAAAWYGASGKVRVSDQLPWIALGVTGLTLTGIGNTGHLFVERLRLQERGRSLVGEVDLASIPTGDGPEPAAAATLPVASPVMSRYHRASCWLVKDKPVEPAEPAAHERAGRRPCGICFRGTPPNPRGRP